MLWIVHSWLSLRFSLTFICQCLWIVHSWLLIQSRVPKVDSALDCPFLIAPSISCVQSWQCSGLSILDCSFNVVCPKLTVLWIVHSWLLLQSRVSKIDSALDCPFLIAPSISCAQSWQCSGLSILDCSFNLVCPKLTVLWIVHSWLLLQSRVSKVDSALECPFLISPSMLCAQSWQCSGFSILDCSFNLVCLKLTVLWIVHSWLLLQSRVPKVDSALDCPFLIVPSVFSNVYLSVSLDCPFLIVPSVFSNVYLSVSLDCPFLIAPSISCAQGWQCSGLSILDCSFNLVCPKLTVLWIVHSWLLLQSRVPKVDSALDCPFLIAPSISCVQSWQCSGLSILECRPFGFL